MLDYLDDYTYNLSVYEDEQRDIEAEREEAEERWRENEERRREIERRGDRYAVNNLGDAMRQALNKQYGVK
jgi:hypothetical protein